MNKIFKVIWNQATQNFVVVSELTKRRGKQSSSTDQRLAPNKLLVAMGMAGALLMSESALAATAAVAVADVAGGTGTITADRNPVYISTDQWGRVALGNNSNAQGSNSPLAIGGNSNSNGESAIAIGRGSSSTGSKSIALGRDSSASNTENIAIGSRSRTEGELSTTIGGGATSTVKKAVVIGAGAKGIRIKDETDDKVKNPHVVVIGTDAMVRNVEKEQSRGTTVIGGNALAGFLTPEDGSITTENNLNDADYATATGALDPNRLMYRAGIKDAAGNPISGVDEKGNVISFTSNEATAIGFDARAIGDQSIAIGAQVISGHASVAIGGNDMGAVATTENKAVYKNIVGEDLAENIQKIGSEEFYETTYAKDGSVAIGQKAHANDLFSTAIGTAAYVQEGSELGTAIGTGARVGRQSTPSGATFGSTSAKSTKGGVAIAAGAVAEGDYTTAVGTGANALENNATAVGYKALANATNALAFGANAKSQAENAVAMGSNSNVTSTGESSIAFGTDTTVSGSKSVALGSNIQSLSTNGSVVLGDSSTEVVGTNGASHSVGTVTSATVRTSEGGTFTYSGFAGQPVDAGKYVSIGAKNAERQLKNVAAGHIDANSTDGINGSQLYAVMTQAANPLTFTANNNKASREVFNATTNANETVSNVGLDRQLGQTLNIIGAQSAVSLTRNSDAAVDGAYSAKNIQTIVDNNGIQIQMAENPEFNSATIGKAGKVDENGNPVVQSSNGNYYPAGTQLDENGNPVDPSVQPIDPNTVKNDTAVALTSDKGVSTTDTTLEPRDPNDPSTNVTVNNPPTALSVKDANGDNSQINGIASALSTKEVATNNPANATTPAGKDTLVDLTPPTDPADKAKWESSAVTVGDIVNMGWVVSAEDNKYTDTVKNANEVKFIGKNGITVTGETKGNVREITVAIEEGEVIKPNEGTYNGKPIVVVDGDKVYDKDDIDPTTGKPLAGKDPIKNPNNPTENLSPSDKGVVNNGDKFVTGHKVAQAIQESGFIVGKETDTSSINFNNKDEKVNPNDELRFADGKGTIVSTGTVEQIDPNGEVVTKTVVKVDVDTGTSTVQDDGKAAPIKYTDANGNPITKNADGTYTDVDGNTITKNPDGSYVDGSGNPVTVTEEDQSNKVATIGDITNTINNVFHTVNTTKTNEQITSAANNTGVAVKAGDTLNFVAAKNLEIKQDNHTITYGLSSDIEVNSVKIGKPTKVDSNGNPVVEGKDGNYYPAGTEMDQTTGNPTDPNVAPIDSADVKDIPAVNMTYTTATVADGNIAPAVNMNGATLTNITSNLPNTTSVENEPTNKAPITAQNAADLAKKSGSNAATLGDVLNAGWNLQENGADRDFVKPYDTVNFVNGTGTVANVTSDGSVSNVTYHVAVDDKTTEITYTNKAGDTLYKQADGTYNTKSDGSGTRVNAGNVTGSRVSAKTSPISVNNATGQVNTPVNPTALATAGDVANAINNSGFTLTTTASKGEVAGSSNYRVNPGKTVTIDAGKNIQITQNNGVISVATKDDVEFNSVKAGPVTINNKGIDAGNTKITNVARGTAPNDAVNVSQLKEATGDINNKIDRNTKDLRAGLAGARAAAGLPQVYLPGKSMVAVSAGAYRDQSAIAVGYSRASDNGKLILKLQGDTNSRGEVGGSVGVGYQW
ncbi:YadA-like family protein [Rodentibacter heidelbergensis]|uniref:Adhesin n=1 Tax=Rodentibacter heidelbergensis TaxID=1908258 RepID=A0A1V3ICJ6_9PAST|nr:YadA-like family protein [Rodentibacter heidelbergensis]OOF37636.1 hypothetical protein BKK48_01535 [Rodentibacter heidelbergensis]